MCREHYKSLPEGLETFISSIKPTETIYHRELYKKLNVILNKYNILTKN